MTKKWSRLHMKISKEIHAAKTSQFSYISIFVLVTTKYDYAEVIRLSILFYEAQRSGDLPSNNRIPYRGDSALDDEGFFGEDLTGGWFDGKTKIYYKQSFSVYWITMKIFW